jgi:hypothetical protein
VAILPSNLAYELLNPPLTPGSGFQFGRGTRVHVTRAQFSAPEYRINDVPNNRADGISFGPDYLGGRLITFDINIKTRDGDTVNAHDLYSHMEQAWLTEDTYIGASRLVPDEVSELIMNRHGSTKIAYGRPRQCEPTTGAVDRGWIPVTAQFQMSSHKFYEYQWRQNSISIAPGNSGGFDFPLSFPLVTVSISTDEDIVIVGGNTETWMLNTITAPNGITAPEIEVVGYYKISTAPTFSLAPGETLDIDPRPWTRRIHKNGYENVAGEFTQQSRRIGMQTLPPGVHQIVLRGQDASGTASLTTRWRDATTTW